MSFAFTNLSFWQGRLRWFPHYAARLASNPRQEALRIRSYSRNSQREAFLSFQTAYVNSLLPTVRSLKAVQAASEASSHGAVGKSSPSPGSRAEAPLHELLIQYGSDKSSIHDYDVIYEKFSELQGIPKTVLEIGLGTSSSLPSSMGPLGRPGASARAFRDWGCFVIGCDIDKETLFNEPGILTLHMDQLAPRSFCKLEDVLGALGPVDLAVIDGLHTPEADLNSLLLLAPWLSSTGLLVVEDVENDPRILSMWKDVLAALPEDFCALLVSTKAASVVLLGRSPYWTQGRLASLYQAHA